MKDWGTDGPGLGRRRHVVGQGDGRGGAGHGRRHRGRGMRRGECGLDAVHAVQQLDALIQNLNPFIDCWFMLANVLCRSLCGGIGEP
jgi:hypothetical protein